MPLIDTFTRRSAKMPLLDLEKMTVGLSTTWSGLLRDRDRSLRSGNYPETTRYNYLLAAAQLARFLGEYSPDPDADAAAEDPVEVSRAHIEAFQAWMIETRSASTALNKHKGLQQFFKWLMSDEGEIDRSPMERVRQPKMPQKLIPVIRDEETSKVLGTCKGREFVQLRDEAIIRLYCNTGARLSEVGNLMLEDIDLTTESAHFHGKGSRDRRVRFGPRTARAVGRYLRARGKHKAAHLPDLWLAERGVRRLAPNGIKIMLKRRGLAAGLVELHAHRWRHTFVHEWKRAGGDTGDLMLLLGWTSEEMPRRYGAMPLPSVPRKPTSGSGSAIMSEPSAMPARRVAVREQQLAFRAVTAISGVVVGLTFLFGFGNVWTLALKLGVSGWVAPLVAPAVDLSVLALLLAIRYLALYGAPAAALRPARRLLLSSSLLS